MSSTNSIDVHETYPPISTGTIPIDTTYRRASINRIFTPDRTRHFMKHRMISGMSTHHQIGEAQTEEGKFSRIAAALQPRAQFIGHITYKVALEGTRHLESYTQQLGVPDGEHHVSRLKEAILRSRIEDYYGQAEELNRYTADAEKELWVGITDSFRTGRLGRLAGFNVVQRHDEEAGTLNVPGVLLFDGDGAVRSMPTYADTNGLYLEVPPIV